MGNEDASKTADEMLAALDKAEALEAWIQRLDHGAASGTRLSESMRIATKRLLGAESPDAARWEQLLVAVAKQSAHPKGQAAYEACKAAIAKLSEMVDEGLLQDVASEQIVTLASALTLALAAQRRHHQLIEETVGVLYERFPNLMPEMAQRCQDICQRMSQVSGAKGLYVWDIRREEWRLSQDFKPYRPM